MQKVLYCCKKNASSNPDLPVQPVFVVRYPLVWGLLCIWDSYKYRILENGMHTRARTGKEQFQAAVG